MRIRCSRPTFYWGKQNSFFQGVLTRCFCWRQNRSGSIKTGFIWNYLESFVPQKNNLCNKMIDVTIVLDDKFYSSFFEEPSRDHSFFADHPLKWCVCINKEEKPVCLLVGESRKVLISIEKKYLVQCIFIYCSSTYQ